MSTDFKRTKQIICNELTYDLYQTSCFHFVLILTTNTVVIQQVLSNNIRQKKFRLYSYNKIRKVILLRCFFRQFVLILRQHFENRPMKMYLGAYLLRIIMLLILVRTDLHHFFLLPFYNTKQKR